MYTFVTSLCLPRALGGQWLKLDVSKRTLASLIEEFRRVFLTIHDPYTDQDRYVDLQALLRYNHITTITVDEALALHAGKPLDYVDGIPDGKLKYARYTIANKVGYRYEFTKAGYHLDHSIASDAMTDLRLTRPGFDTDMSLLHTHCFITVNGFAHRTDTDGENLFIIDGGKSVKVAQEAKIGITSFYDIGKVDKYSIPKESIIPSIEGRPLKEKIIFSIEEDIGNHVFMLSLGGYIVVPDGKSLWRVGDKSFCLDLGKIPYLSRFLESREFIDVSSLGLETFDINKKAVNIDELYSDEVIRRYFCMSNTFFIRVHTENLSAEKHTIRQMNTPGHYVLSHDTDMPMFSQHGRLIEYWSQKKGDRYLISVPDPYFRNYSAVYRQRVSPQLIDDGLMVQNPIYNRTVTALEISSY